MDTVTKLFKVKPPVQYGSKLKPVECSNKDLIMGVELETENAHPDAYTYVGSISNGWIVDRDNSLRGGDRAYEFISKPMPMQNLLPELVEFFRITGFNDTNYSDRCSVHVHTNVTDFTQDMLASLSMIYTVVEDVLFRYVNHYKEKTPDGYSRDTNLYCIPWNQCRMNHRLVEKLFSGANVHLSRWQKYTALNLLPITAQGTVEWRHMHGTADMEKLTTWINLIGSIMGYAKRTPLDEVIKTVTSLNDTSTYRRFFEDVLRGYLEYKDEYQASLSEGVINAKYGLFDWDKSKIKVAKKAEVGSDEWLATNLAQLRALDQEPRPAAVRRGAREAAAIRPGRFIDDRPIADRLLRENAEAMAQAAVPIQWDIGGFANNPVNFVGGFDQAAAENPVEVAVRRARVADHLARFAAIRQQAGTQGAVIMDDIQDEEGEDE